MKWVSALVYPALCLLLACGSARAQHDDAGLLSSNRNTTNSLTGVNDEPDPFLGAPVVADPAPVVHDRAPVSPAVARGPVNANADRAPPNPNSEVGGFFSGLFSEDVPKGPRSGFGLTDR